ncbi:ABC transporter substrate-binding protein [Hyphomicrobium sp.]|uniref:ABC transporter substrate-binding protein n=1 Tax=Hyphomicrobium sp. TaxID=82 RepID=UPI002FDE2AD8
MTTVWQRLARGGAIFTLAATVLSLVALAGPETQAQSETPAKFMQRVANQLIAAQRSGSEAEYATVLRSHADVPSIAISALGSYAQSLAKSDRPAYYAGMINFISRYAAKEGPRYPVARAIMVGQTKETASGVYVDSRITLKSGDTYDVRWRLVRRGGVYKVREAEIIGFEMTTFLNTLFQNYIAENGGNPRTLVIALNR